MLLESCWTALVHFFSFQSLFSSQQYPLPPDGGVEYPASPTAAAELAEPSDALTFKPIGASDTFECVYPGLKNKYDAIPGGNQKIWLQPKQGTSNLQRYDINTNYETTTPQGKVRDVWLDATQLDKDHPAMPDGEEYIVGNYFNNTYPGHRIEACWGDTVRVHVTNKLKHNGTAIHMHGIRMLDTNLADGVPGVTQCPIAPGDTFTYEFKAVQYGTTWYHSHYSLQYTDGLLGPLTIYGPASVEKYDEAIEPLMLADHIHQSAFEKWSWEVIEKHGRGPIKAESILLNNHGNYVGKHPDKRYRTKVKPGKKYLLRLINASTDTAFIFSIDEHSLQVIGADLVPVDPYPKDYLYIGIGQRYHVIVQTKEDKKYKSNNYWIRAQPAEGCYNWVGEPNERQGIFQYNELALGPPNSIPHVIEDTNCQDEDHDQLHPVVKWNSIPKPTKDDLTFAMLPNKVKRQDFQLPEEDGHSRPTIGGWKLLGSPAWVNYRDLTVNHLNDRTRPATAALVEKDKNPTADTTWAYMVIDGGHQRQRNSSTGEAIVPAAHPIHLHGHDFALLHQSYNKFNDAIVNDTDALQDFIDHGLNYNNPARRDVVLLPINGFIVIAFKVDNPGAWLLHCHIAWHASGGLALQILEDRKALDTRFKSGPGKKAIDYINGKCKIWDDWYKNTTNHWDPNERFQDDSGI